MYAGVEQWLISSKVVIPHIVYYLKNFFVWARFRSLLFLAKFAWYWVRNANYTTIIACLRESAIFSSGVCMWEVVINF